MSQILKAIFTSTYFSAFQTNQDYVRRLCSVSKDIAKQKYLQTNNDILITSLKNVRSVNTVLELVNIHDKSMNQKHLVLALRMLFNLQKMGNSDMSTPQIIKHANFELLCRSLRRKVGQIEPNEAVDALKVLSFLGVQADSLIVQVLMQIIRHNINNLSLQQIIFIDFLLAQFKRTPLSEALKIALPLVFEIQLPHKVDRENLSALTDYLKYASHANVSENCVEFISTCLLTCPAQFDGKIASSIVWSLSDLEADVFFEPLLLKAVDSMVLNAYSLKFEDMETCLSKLSKKYSAKTPFYYHEVFFDMCANMVTEKDLGFHYAIYILRKFNRIGHISKSLLNYVSLKCLEEPELHKDPIFLSDVAFSMATTSIRPMHWEHLATLLENTPLPNEPNDIFWLRLAMSLCSLGIYRTDVLQKALNENYLRTLFKHKGILDNEYLNVLNQTIATFKPEFDRFLPSPEFLKMSLSKVKVPTSYPLEAPLIRAFGGNDFIVTNVMTRLGHRIDHVIALDNSGNAVPINTGSNEQIAYLEDMKLSPELKIVLILGLSNFHYALNTHELRTTTVLMMRSLAARGYTVLPVSIDKWQNLQDFEKIPYLSQMVKEGSTPTTDSFS